MENCKKIVLWVVLHDVVQDLVEVIVVCRGVLRRVREKERKYRVKIVPLQRKH